MIFELGILGSPFSLFQTMTCAQGFSKNRRRASGKIQGLIKEEPRRGFSEHGFFQSNELFRKGFLAFQQRTSSCGSRLYFLKMEDSINVHPNIPIPIPSVTRDHHDWDPASWDRPRFLLQSVSVMQRPDDHGEIHGTVWPNGWRCQQPQFIWQEQVLSHPPYMRMYENV